MNACTRASRMLRNKAGHEAHHVNRRGWSGLKDHQLREVALQGEFVFVTNNARDFRKLMEQTELHAGLIVIIPNVTLLYSASCLSTPCSKRPGFPT